MIGARAACYQLFYVDLRRRARLTPISAHVSFHDDTNMVMRPYLGERDVWVYEGKKKHKVCEGKNESTNDVSIIIIDNYLFFRTFELGYVTRCVDVTTAILVVSFTFESCAVAACTPILTVPTNPANFSLCCHHHYTTVLASTECIGARGLDILRSCGENSL